MAEDSSSGLEFQVLPIPGFSVWPSERKVNVLFFLLCKAYEIIFVSFQGLDI